MKRRTARQAILAKCLDCCCHQEGDVKTCHIKSCGLWPFRMGKGYLDPSKPYVSGEAKDMTEASDTKTRRRGPRNRVFHGGRAKSR